MEKHSGESPRIVTMVPCRTKSQRLPGKATLPINGISSIERCLLNTLAIKRSDHTVLATSTNPEDSVLEDHDLGGKVTVIRGSEDDVLARFLEAIDRFEPDIVLRITGDCPLISFEIADLLIESHIESGAEVSHLGWGDYPPGLNSEVYSANALRRLRALMPDTSLSEYLILYFTNNPEYFDIHEMTVPGRFRHPEWRLTLDTREDLDLFELMFSSLGIGREPIAFEQIARFFAERPDAAAMNADIAIKYKSDRKLVEYLKERTTIKDR